VALAQWAQDSGVPTTIHALLDGRDTPQKSADGYLAWLEERLQATPLVRVGSIGGRYWAMDRDQRWDRVERAWKLLVDGEAEFTFPTSTEAITAAYARNETDEFVAPTATAHHQPIREGDGVLFFNFRGDRARQFSHALVNPAFVGFQPRQRPAVKLVTFTQYDAALDPFVKVAYPPQDLANILGEVVSRQGLKQFRTAETEKYAHVTFFFNDYTEKPFKGEDRQIVPSPRVRTYDLKPEMSAREVTEVVLERLDSGKYDVLVVNFANPDMVGHTGVLAAALKAAEVVDECVGRILDKVQSLGGAALVTADHGNFERMIDGTPDKPHTSHTIGDVPLVVVDGRFKGSRLREGGNLADIGPTLLEMMGLPKPDEMTGRSLLEGAD